MSWLRFASAWTGAAVLLGALSNAGLAQPWDSSDPASACARETNPSPGCWEELRHQRAPVAAPSELSPKGVPGFAVLGTLGLLPASVPTLSYSGWVTPRQAPGTVEQQRLTIQVPVYQDGRDAYSLSAGASWLRFGAEQALSGSGIPVPEDLWKIELGGSYSRRLESDALLGGRVSLGSASDQPFASFDVVTVGLSAYYSWAVSERSRWMLTLLFSNNNPIIDYVPIPGFVYAYQTPTFVGLFGFPFSSLSWRPSGPWALTFSFFGLTINSEVTYGDPRKFQLFTGFSWVQQSYLRENRPSSKDLFYYDEKHLPIGVRFPITRSLRSELSAGYSFSRSVYEGIHIGNANDGSADLGNSWYGAWSLRAEL
jgi:hypothetical protein